MKSNKERKILNLVGDVTYFGIVSEINDDMNFL